VPVILALTSRGDVGEVGAIDVDVETGQMHVTAQLIAEVNARAEGLALSTAPAAAR
jgi:N-acetylglutamate synthase-like GNAT family acetyltransferase